MQADLGWVTDLHNGAYFLPLLAAIKDSGRCSPVPATDSGLTIS